MAAYNICGDSFLKMEISYDAIVKNAYTIKSKIGSAKLCAVVKNDAYGHGLYRTVSALRGVADCFAVGTLDEALAIAPLGVETLILLPLNRAQTELAARRGIAVTVCDFETLAYATACGAKMHIKIDSGMGRLGFGEDELSTLTAQLHGDDNVVGCFSHLYGEDELSQHMQRVRFLSACEAIDGVLGRKTVRHIASTHAVLDGSFTLDMCRVGLGLYGYGLGGLVCAKRVFAEVIAARFARAGTTVGYGGFVIRADTNVAVLNAGYANGISRGLIGSEVLLGEQKCKVLAVCMGMTIIDTGGVLAKKGEYVELLGRCNPSNSNVIVYELLCNLR